MRELIFFTDLDGSLLDHADYAFTNAKPVVDRIKKAKIPLIFVTSKTRSEVESLQQEMGIREPFIVENGGAIYFPEGYRGWSLERGRNTSGYTVIELGVRYAEVRAFLGQFGSRFGIRGFGDWSVAEIAERTGLSLGEAKLAAQREFTEPFVGPATGMTTFEQLAVGHGLKVTRGGRFYHLIGAGQDKGVAVRTVREIVGRQMGGDPLSIGIGDSENDLPMLAQVDIPVLILRPDGSCLDLRMPRLVIAKWPGSKGWSFAVKRILDECTTTVAGDF